MNSLNRPLADQLIRSSTSVAANFCAASCGRSDAEFYAKICIVVEECDETLFWLNFLIKINLIGKEESDKLLNEAKELVRLFATTKKTMKEKMRKS